MVDKKERLLSKINALLQKTEDNGCSEQEALAAANMVQRLLNDYNLSMSEVEYSSSEFCELKVDSGKIKRDHMCRIIESIAYFTDCEYYYESGGVDTNGKKSIKYVFFGEKKSTETANYMYIMMRSSIAFESVKYTTTEEYKSLARFTSTRRIMTSFRTGMAIRLSDRIFNIKYEREKENKKVEETGLCVYNRMAIVSDKFNEFTKDVEFKQQTTYKTTVNSTAMRSGEIVADSVDIVEGRTSSITNTPMLK